MSDIGFRRGLPRTALALDEGRSDGSRRFRRSNRRVLVYGDLLMLTERFLVSHGAVLIRVASAAEAVAMLAEQAFDIVVLDAYAPGGGLHLVKAVKFGHRTLDVPDDVLEKAGAMARLTPFIVLPLADSTEFAVIVRPPDLAFLDDGKVEDVILHLDVSKLLQRMN